MRDQFEVLVMKPDELYNAIVLFCSQIMWTFVYIYLEWINYITIT